MLEYVTLMLLAKERIIIVVQALHEFTVLYNQGC